MCPMSSPRGYLGMHMVLSRAKHVYSRTGHTHRIGINQSVEYLCFQAQKVPRVKEGGLSVPSACSVRPTKHVPRVFSSIKRPREKGNVRATSYNYLGYQDLARFHSPY